MLKKAFLLFIYCAIWPLSAPIQAVPQATPLQMWRYYGRQALNQPAALTAARSKSAANLKVNRKGVKLKKQAKRNPDDGLRRSRQLFIGGILLLVGGFLGLLLASAGENYVLLLFVLLAGAVGVVLLVASLIVRVKAILQKPDSQKARSLPIWALALGLLAILPWIVGFFLNLSAGLIIQNTFIPLLGLAFGLPAFLIGLLVENRMFKGNIRKGRGVNGIGFILGLLATMLFVLI